MQTHWWTKNKYTVRIPYGLVFDPICANISAFAYLSCDSIMNKYWQWSFQISDDQQWQSLQVLDNQLVTYIGVLSDPSSTCTIPCSNGGIYKYEIKKKKRSTNQAITAPKTKIRPSFTRHRKWTERQHTWRKRHLAR